MFNKFLENMADEVFNFKMFPIFDIANYLLVALEIYKKFNHNPSKRHSHPLASLLSTILLAFSGSIFANLLLGEPALTSLDNSHVILCCLMWFIVFYLPHNIGFTIGSSFPVMLVANVLNEVYRAKKLRVGLLQAERIYPNSWFLIAIIATVRSNGAGFCKYFFRLIQKTWVSDHVDFVQPSSSIKASFFVSLLFQYRINSNIVHLEGVVMFVCLKIILILQNMSHGLHMKSNPDATSTSTNAKID